MELKPCAPSSNPVKQNKPFSIESLISNDNEDANSENSDVCCTTPELEPSQFQPFFNPRSFRPPEKLEPSFQMGLPLHVLHKYSATPYFGYNWPLLYNSWLQNAGLLGGLMGVPRPPLMPNAPRIPNPAMEQDSQTSFVPLSPPAEESDASLSPYDLSRNSGKQNF